MTEYKTSRIVNKDNEETEGGEQHEVAAQISFPHDGGWGWVVVVAAFISIFILDGISYTFGSLLDAMAKDLEVSDSMAALINSTAVALYFISSPFASAFINRFGFRECAMCGSLICSFALFTTYFVKNFALVFLFYGVVAGFGYSLINMSTGLVVGFYFEKLRSLALAIATCGSSLGIMTLFALNTVLVKQSGWRTTTLLHSGLLGLIFFLGMAFRPLMTFTVTNTEEDTTRTLAFLPSVSVTETIIRATPVVSSTKVLASTRAERLFGAVSNVNFPTAAKVVATPESAISPQPGPSGTVASRSKITLRARNQGGSFNQRQMKQVQSIISRSSEPGKESRPVVDVNITEPTEPSRGRKKPGLCARIFRWDPHETQARPLYRDDAFYEGKLKDLPAYKKSVINATPEETTGLEYQMAVTRAVAVTDLNEERGVFTTSIRRVLATMMDTNLFKKNSFLLICSSGFFTYLGFLVPYVYLQDRNLRAGLDPGHCSLFISVIGFANAIGRLVLGSIASKIDPLKMFAFFCTLAGLSTMASDISYNVYYQYFYCCVFGFSISVVACLRSIVIVSLYGLDKLTNATGMMLIFLGFGNLVSTPLAGIIKNSFGYSIAFYGAGGFMTVSGLILMLVKRMYIKEQRAQEIEAANRGQRTTDRQ